MKSLFNNSSSDYVLQTIVFAKSVKDIKQLELCFPFPDARPMWRTKSYSVISAILGHEGPGSVFSYLKSKGWITSQSAGVSPMAHEIAVIDISIRLTDEGFSESFTVVSDHVHGI